MLEKAQYHAKTVFNPPIRTITHHVVIKRHQMQALKEVNPIEALSLRFNKVERAARVLLATLI